MRKFLIVVAAAIALVYLWNASWVAGAPVDPQIRLIAHRGVHQTFHREGLTNETCTAERMIPADHDFLENTIPSMRAAFEAGADIVELDLHPTTDGQFAVFHDWTVDCRTEGAGVTREHEMPYLKSLDIGFGYTADGGASYPLRGTGVGMMPELADVLDAFPRGRFLLDFKGGEAREGDMLAARLVENPQWRETIWSAYGGWQAVNTAAHQIDGLDVFWGRQAKTCLIRYFAIGWSGYVPEACRNTKVMVPISHAWLLWGWPHRFRTRMNEAGSDIVLVGPYRRGTTGTTGIDSEQTARLIPGGFDGYIWTNRIETIGPLLKGR
jgi:glycerophosphoryl diester phosphodiesterase